MLFNQMISTECLLITESHTNHIPCCNTSFLCRFTIRSNLFMQKMDLQYPPNWFLLKDSNLLQIFVQICRALGDEEGCGYQPKYAATLVRVVSSSCVSMFTCVTVYHDCLMIAFARESQNEREMLSHSPLFT